MEISHLDAAKRELETAVRLFLNYGDPVSIHLLGHSSLDMLRNLGNKQGINSFVFDEMVNMVKKPRQKEFIDAIRAPGNYFKHVDKGQKDTITFPPETTEYLLYDASLIYEKLTKERYALFQAFILFFGITHKNAFYKNIQEKFDLKVKEAERLGIDLSSRSTYIELANALSENIFSK